MMTTSGDLIKLISRLIKVDLFPMEEEEQDSLKEKIEALVGKDLDHLSASSRSPFMQESKLRSVVASHNELLRCTPRDYQILLRLRNWVQAEVYRDPDDFGFDSLESA